MRRDEDWYGNKGQQGLWSRSASRRPRAGERVNVIGFESSSSPSWQVWPATLPSRHAQAHRARTHTLTHKTHSRARTTKSSRTFFCELGCSGGWGSTGRARQRNWNEKTRRGGRQARQGRVETKTRLKRERDGRRWRGVQRGAGRMVMYS